MASGDWQQVTALARQKLADEPENVDAMLHLGMALYRSEQIEEAREWFQKAVAATLSGDAAFRHAPALNNLATTCMRLKDWEAAIEALEALRSMVKYGSPGTQKVKLPKVLINLLVCYREHRRPRQAKAMYQLLIEVDPTAAARIDPGDLNVPLGAPLKSAAQLGAELVLTDDTLDRTSSLASGAQQVERSAESRSGDSRQSESSACSTVPPFTFPKQCPSCGVSVEPDHNFCGVCGAALTLTAAGAV